MPNDFDSLTPHFRRLRERWPEAPTLGNHYQAVIDGFDGNQHGLVEAVKSFVECVCLTILGEHGKAMPSADPSMTEMLVEVLRTLGLQNTRGASKLDKVLSAHNKLADALSDMRNENGPVAHGKDGFLDCLTKNHVRTYLLTADTLLAILLAALEGSEPDLKSTREPYDRFGRFHSQIDKSVSIQSDIEYENDLPVLVVTITTAALPDGVELRVEPSRLLYAVDRTAYAEVLAASAEEPDAEDDGGAAAEASAPASVPSTSPAPQIAHAYTGALLPLATDLRKYLANLKVPPPTPPAPEADLVDSLLTTAESNMGPDWREREMLRAAMKVALRKVFVQFGVPESPAKQYAEHLVSWFRIQAVGLLTPQGT